MANDIEPMYVDFDTTDGRVIRRAFEYDVVEKDGFITLIDLGMGIRPDRAVRVRAEKEKSGWDALAAKPIFPSRTAI